MPFECTIKLKHYFIYLYYWDDDVDYCNDYTASHRGCLQAFELILNMGRTYDACLGKLEVKN